VTFVLNKPLFGIKHYKNVSHALLKSQFMIINNPNVFKNIVTMDINGIDKN
jgi:hypothetical protein